MGSVLSKRPTATVEMDDDEKALVKKVRMKLLEDQWESLSRGVSNKCGDGAVAGKGTGLSDVDVSVGCRSGENKTQFRSRLMGRMNSLIVKLSQETKTKKVRRGTAEYNLKNSRYVKVAYGEEAQKFLYSEKYIEHHAFCDAFFEEFKQNKGGKVKPGAKAEAFRKNAGIVWKHYCWENSKTEDVV